MFFSVGSIKNLKNKRWTKTETSTKTSTDTLERKFVDGKIGIKNNSCSIVMYTLDNVKEAEAWCVRGKLSRVDGPAMLSYKNGSLDCVAWYRGGVLRCVPVFYQTV